MMGMYGKLAQVLRLDPMDMADKIVEQDNRIKELEAENERLRDGIKHDFLVTTNHIIKLEELVRDMWRDCICQSDVTCNLCVVDCNVTEGCALERRITELGIEVER